MKLKSIVVVTTVLLLFLNINFIQAEQEPTQQFNKIFVSPFYRESMDRNTNYTYTLIVNPPDKISNVKSAIITFSVWHNPSIRYYLWVNGQTCNNPTFYVSTSYENAGNNEIYFDCSNIITKEGTYTLTLKPDDDTGTITGWLDLTYMNRPDGTLDIFGTEYRPGERARIFLQLKDAQGNPENNGGCSIDVFYPNRVNATADIFIDNAPLFHLEGSNGLYFYDIATLPYEQGVYMMTAGCTAQLQSVFVYETTGSDPYGPERVNTTGTYYSNTLVLDSYNDYAYTKCDSSGGNPKICQATYNFNTTIHYGNQSNFSDMVVFYMGESDYPITMSFEAYNFSSSSWKYLPNNLTFSGSTTGANPTGLNDFASNYIPDPDDFISSEGIIKIRLTSTYGTTFVQFNNGFNINLRTESGVIQELKGSGEIHINDWFNNYTQLISDEVWKWQNRSLTDPVNVANLNNISQNVWNYPSRNLTFYQDVTNYTKVAEYVWNFNSMILSDILNQIASAIWNYNQRNLTYSEDTTDYGLIQSAVWNASSRTLTEFNITVATNITADQIAGAIWNYNGTVNDNIVTQFGDYITCLSEQIFNENNGGWGINIVTC